MLVSYKWLQTYFDEPLPPVKELTDILTMGVFEIEGTEEKGDDTVIDVKVLPDRAPYGYSHRYIAQEISALIDRPIKFPHMDDVTEGETNRPLDISIVTFVDAEVAYCSRYIGRVVEGVTVGPSPVWLKSILETLGQRSISSIVDLTNYVMLETGQPLHAFDADKVDGDIVVRLAKDGEEIIILDGTTLKLDKTMLVIADNTGPIALAGVKGGKRAEISENTKNIIIESACFNSTITRKTSQKVGIRNESSKRFENGVTPERAGLAMAMLTAHIVKLNPTAVVGGAIDVYPNPVGDRILSVSVKAVVNRLGIDLSINTIKDVLSRCGFIVAFSEEDADALIVSVPPHRVDININEDIAEEVGRVYGYDKVEGIVPSSSPERVIQKNFYYINLIRRAIADIGFSEVYTYSLTDHGDMAVQNPLTVERAYMRNNIRDLLSTKFLFNMRHIDLVGQKDVRLFEVGKIFGEKNERYSLAYGVGRSRLSKGQDSKVEMIAVASYLFNRLGASDEILQNIASKISYKELSGDAQLSCVGLVAEIDIEPIISTLPDPVDDVDLGRLVDSFDSGMKFRPISPYPFSSRDVAVFVPGIGKEKEVLDTVYEALRSVAIKDSKKDSALSVSDSVASPSTPKTTPASSAFDLLVRATLFDVFTKEKEGEETKTSYAYRLVFQSPSRTLTEEEVVSAMKAVTEAISKKEGWQVR